MNQAETTPSIRKRITELSKLTHIQLASLYADIVRSHNADVDATGARRDTFFIKALYASPDTLRRCIGCYSGFMMVGNFAFAEEVLLQVVHEADAAFDEMQKAA